MSKVSGESLLRLRDLAQLSVYDVRRSLQAALEKFEGDVAAGVGYVHCAALAVHRGGTPEQREAALRVAAQAFAERYQGDPQWQELTLRVRCEAGLPTEQAA